MQNRALLAAFLLLTGGMVQAECTKGTFAIPDSKLLFAKPYKQLCIISETQKARVDMPQNQSFVFHIPSLAPTGDHIAWGVLKSWSTPRADREWALGMFDRNQKEWRLYGAFEEIGSTAFSPDGSKVAFAASTGGKSSIWILELDTKQLSSIPTPRAVDKKEPITWSPDGNRLVVALSKAEDQTDEITVIELSGRATLSAEGVNPLWSPSGEWIAFVDKARQRLFLISPDGSQKRLLRDLRRRMFGYRMFVWGGTWSPDSKYVLVNEMKGDGPNLDIVQVDVDNGKATTRKRNALALVGWVSNRP